MTKRPAIDALTLPFRLPGIWAAKLAPKVDILASDKTLDRRIRNCKWLGDFFGPLTMIGFGIAGMLAGGVMLGALSLGSLTPALLLTCTAYMTGTVASICNKHRIECLAVKCLNTVVGKMNADAAASEAAIAVPAAPEFNHAAATTLDKDLQVRPAIKLSVRSAAP